jgi:hypothetical protein
MLVRVSMDCDHARGAVRALNTREQLVRAFMGHAFDRILIHPDDHDDRAGEQAQRNEYSNDNLRIHFVVHLRYAARVTSTCAQNTRHDDDDNQQLV